MEPASLLACYSAIATDHDYTLLEGQPLSRLPDSSWYIPSHPAPPIPFVLGQCVLLLNLPSHIFFGCLRSIIRLERSYLVVTVSPEPTVLKSHVHPAQYVDGVRTSMRYLQTTCSVDLVIVLFRVDNTCHRSCDLVTRHTLCCI